MPKPKQRANKLLNIIKKQTYKPYNVVVELHVNDIYVGQVAVPVKHWNKRMAIKKAAQIVERGARVQVTSANLIK